jgi:hypothetical protein
LAKNSREHLGHGTRHTYSAGAPSNVSQPKLCCQRHLLRLQTQYSFSPRSHYGADARDQCHSYNVRGERAYGSSDEPCASRVNQFGLRHRACSHPLLLAIKLFYPNGACINICCPGRRAQLPGVLSFPRWSISLWRAPRWRSLGLCGWPWGGFYHATVFEIWVRVQTSTSRLRGNLRVPLVPFGYCLALLELRRFRQSPGKIKSRLV